MANTEVGRFIHRIATLTKDDEYLDEENPEWDMPADDAYETLHSLIDEARRLIGWEPRDPRVGLVKS